MSNIFNIFNSKQKKSKPINQRYLLAKSGQDLLSTLERQQYLKKIKRLLSITDQVWEDHYLYAITKFCEIVQDVPASQLHHHNYNGGLIDHTLEALHIGIKASHGYVLPPNCEPEYIAGNADKWRFGAFISILSHDIGKIVTDIEVVYKVKGKFEKWHPWYEFIPQGTEYTFRYKDKIKIPSVGKTLHEKASMSLVPKLLTKEASAWLFSDIELLAQVFSTITHSTFGGDVISQIVKQADMHSVSENMGGEGYNENIHQTTTKPLHEKLIQSLVMLANEGLLKRNRPGAAIWITEKYTWVVSKASMEAVREQLIEEGHKSIPKNVVRLFSILNENNLIVKTNTGDSVWHAEVNYFPSNWKQKLTFLKFENSTLWPTSQPDAFDGEITSKENESAVDIIPSIEPNELTYNDNNKATNQKINKVGLQKNLEFTDKKLNEEVLVPNNIKDQENKCCKKKQAFNFGDKDPMKIDFFVWLQREIKKLKLRVNEPKSPVHFTEKYIILVTPSIFIKYLKSNPLKERIYKSKAGNKKPFTALQREIESLDIHKRTQNGTNIVSISVTGIKNQSLLNGYALKREYFPELDNFSKNNALSLE